MPTRDLVGLRDIDRSDIETLLDRAGHFRTRLQASPVVRLETCRDRVVVLAFFESSTRTRVSFELAARRLGAEAISFAAAASSVSKGESLRDTAENLAAMRIDAVVVRHPATGAPHSLAQRLACPVINAGDGIHEHPTQALLDLFTLRAHLGPLEGRVIAIVGDVLHSRVARSDIFGLRALGARVVVAGPGTMVDPRLAAWGVEVRHTMDDVVEDADAIVLLRIQRERLGRAVLPSDREYAALYGLDAARAARMRPGALVLHPGPMNRGVEISPEVARSERAVILDQVTNGVAVRMAVLEHALGVA